MKYDLFLEETGTAKQIFSDLRTFNLPVFTFLCLMQNSRLRMGGKKIINRSQNILNYLHISVAPGTEERSNFPTEGHRINIPFH